MISIKIRPFLWSYDPKKIDLKRDKKRVILNALNLGDKPATDWLFKKYTKTEIKNVLKKYGKGELSPKSWNYWTLVLKVKK